MMTEEEQNLLRATSKAAMQLFQDRDDMIAGITAVIVDLYRGEFQEGRQTKAEALFRLQIQRDVLAKHSPRQTGTKFLDSVIQTLETVQFNAAQAPRELKRLRNAKAINGHGH